MAGIWNRTLDAERIAVALWEHERDAKDQFSALHLFIHYWAQGKEENRRAWAQAMNTVVTNGTGSGAVLFQSFPQEVVDAFSEVTGGQRVRVRLPTERRRCFSCNTRENETSSSITRVLWQLLSTHNYERRSPSHQAGFSSFLLAPKEAAMKVFMIIPLALAATVAGAQTTNQTQIRHVETSLNHLTVLEFGSR
jgi:hypothetical protein